MAHVAPRAGAWIETLDRTAAGKVNTSRPARARGLKPAVVALVSASVASRPARARGLKRFRPGRLSNSYLVAPRAGAWIETRRRASSQTGAESRPARARGLKLVGGLKINL